MAETLRRYCMRITPLSAFGSALRGDTLFGQLCWAIRNRHGESRLADLLAGYTDGRPFAVLSDAFPAGYLPRPTLPAARFALPADYDRKAVKKLRWIPLASLDQPLSRWLENARTDAGMTDDNAPFSRPGLQPHNSINRRTGTTGGDFAPYGMPQSWYQPGVMLEVYAVLDEARLALNELRMAMQDIGDFGFGRDASIGLGKFACGEWRAIDTLPMPPDPNACMTLAPCAPQGLEFDPGRCFYTVFTRFGRHGDRGAHRGNPFKTPVLLADTGAVLSPPPANGLFIGQGLGGGERLSKAIPGTVHQGYAPIVTTRLGMVEEIAA